ncbi:hypothetical protein PAENIP36_18810 [Paenibacillus sp. P36]
MVITEPTALVIQWDDKKVGLLKPFQRFFTGGRGSEAHYGITQRSAEAVEYRCVQQEGLNVFRLFVQNLFNQIVKNEAVAAGKRLDEGSGVMKPFHGNGG